MLKDVGDDDVFMVSIIIYLMRVRALHIETEFNLFPDIKSTTRTLAEFERFEQQRIRNSSSATTAIHNQYKGQARVETACLRYANQGHCGERT